MRIISGFLKGRRFSPPKNFKARPTTDFAKENLFNILNNQVDFEAIKVLDLFGGTGSISYEFASRGSTDVTCVELSYNHYKYILSTVDSLNLNNRIKVIKGDSFKYVEKTIDQYDLIFADPPYDLNKASELPDIVFKRNLLKENGIFILENSGNVEYKSHPNFDANRINGKVNFTFFKNTSK